MTPKIKRNLLGNAEPASLVPQAGRPRLPPSFGTRKGKKGLLAWKWAAERLANAHNYLVASVRPDGRPHMVPIWGCWMNNRFYFNTDRATVKAANLRANPSCIISPENAVEAVIVEGMAHEVHDAATLRRFIALYDSKYDWELDVKEGAFYEVRPRVVLGFLENANDFAATATRWIFADNPASPVKGARGTMLSKRAGSKK